MCMKTRRVSVAPREEASEHTHKGRSARNTVIICVGDDAREFEFGHVFDTDLVIEKKRKIVFLLS